MYFFCLQVGGLINGGAYKWGFINRKFAVDLRIGARVKDL